MSEPTTYDVIQDTRIKGVEDLVQTSYQPFQGPEFSYPVVHQPMDDEMWQYVTLGMGSGLLDVGGQPYWLRELSDVTDTGKLTVSKTTGTAQAILRGFYHRLNQDLTLNFPPVSQKTIYQVVLEYNPLRHKEPGGPIRVRVLTTLDWSGGRHYLPLWDVERDPSSLLSQAKVTQRRPKISPTIHVDRLEHRPDPRTQLWGAQCYVRYGDQMGETFIASGESEETGGPTKWTSLDNPPWKPITLTPAYTAAVPVQYRISRGYIEMRGLVRRKDSDFSTSGASTIGWITGVNLPDVNVVLGANSGRTALLVTAMGDSARDNLVVHTPVAGTRQVSLDNIRIPLT